MANKSASHAEIKLVLESKPKLISRFVREYHNSIAVFIADRSCNSIGRFTDSPNRSHSIRLCPQRSTSSTIEVSPSMFAPYMLNRELASHTRLESARMDHKLATWCLALHRCKGDLPSLDTRDCIVAFRIADDYSWHQHSTRPFITVITGDS